MKAFFTIICLFLSALAAFSQPQKKVVGDPEEAKEHFKHYNYLMAMPIYKALVAKEPKNMEYNYRLGICYLRTHLNKAESVKYFEEASKDPNCHDDTWFFLGRAYHLAGKYDEAIKSYVKYKLLVLKDKVEIEKVNHQIEMCHNAKELVKFPVNITFTNLGPEINSEFPDYFPFITADEHTLFYTSRRKGGHATTVETDGYYSSDIFYSTVGEGKWEKAKNLGSPINTNLDEEIVGLRPDGSELIIYIDHIDADKVENLYSTHKKMNAYTKLELLSESVTNAKEFAGTIFETEDGPILFFSRHDENSIGESDIYSSKKLPNGQWGLPTNLGPNINTKYKEDFPYLAPDGKTLYFSSEGHSSMGGFDLFKSVWDEDFKMWDKPQNLGFPINTPDDEEQICMLKDNSAGYYSAYRPGGLGDLDIYRIKFEDADPKYAIYRGAVMNADTVNKVCNNVNITATNRKTNQEFYFKPNHVTGNYIMALGPGKYSVSISCDGYKEVKEDILVPDFPVRPETVKDYILRTK